jgi:hypothetical protein
MNPDKGFTVAANGKYASDHSKNDYGSWSAGTARTIRITELIQAKIDAGVKMTHLDMTEIQQDGVDTYARVEAPLMIEIANLVKDEYNQTAQ